MNIPFTQVHSLVRVPPPVWLALIFLAGLGLQRVVSLPALSAAVATGCGIAGAGLVACGVLLGIYSVRTFRASHTTVIPHGTASQLVTRGPYRRTRNPMYVSLLTAYVGADLLLGSLWPLILLPLGVILLQRVFIPFEERRLGEIFGEEYERYCARVGRWV